MISNTYKDLQSSIPAWHVSNHRRRDVVPGPVKVHFDPFVLLGTPLGRIHGRLPSRQRLSAVPLGHHGRLGASVAQGPAAVPVIDWEADVGLVDM